MRRRRVLQSLALAPAAAIAAPPDRDVSRITVTGLEVFNVKVNARVSIQLPRAFTLTLNTSRPVTVILDTSRSGGAAIAAAGARANDWRTRLLRMRQIVPQAKPNAF